MDAKAFHNIQADIAGRAGRLFVNIAKGLLCGQSRSIEHTPHVAAANEKLNQRRIGFEQSPPL